MHSLNMPSLGAYTPGISSRSRKLDFATRRARREQNIRALPRLITEARNYCQHNLVVPERAAKRRSTTDRKARRECVARAVDSERRAEVEAIRKADRDGKYSLSIRDLAAFCQEVSSSSAREAGTANAIAPGLSTSTTAGLDEDEAGLEERRRVFGSNKLPEREEV